MPSNGPRHGRQTLILLGAVALIALLVATPLAAGGLGRLVGGLWVSVLAIVAGLIGGIFAP